MLLLVPPRTWGQNSKENSDFKLAVNLFNDGMFDLAAEQLRNFISLYPSTSQGIEARFYLGLTYLKIRKFEDARQTFQNFALSYVDHPRAPDAWVHVAEAFAAMDNRREAASAYERVRVFHPRSPLVPEALLNAARLYRETGDREPAKKDLRTIIQEYPTSKSALPARLAIGEMYAEEGQTELAEAEARRVSESDAPAPVKANALFSVGKIQLSAGLFTHAETAFRQVISTYKGTSAATSAYAELGNLALARKKYDEAVDLFKKVIDDDQADDSLRASALLSTGLARSARGDYRDAQKSFERLTELFPDSPLSPLAHLEAGWAALRDGDEETARSYAEVTLLRPDSGFRARAFILAAQASVAGRDISAAIRFYAGFGAAFQDHPGAPAAFLEAARLTEQELHDARKAAGLYDEIIERFPRRPEIVTAMLGLSRCQEESDDFQGSIRTLQEIIRSFPAHDSVEAIADHVRFLENHRMKDRDTGMEKLARLLGEVLTSKNTPELSLQLGYIYFNEMKDYPSAIRQFTTAIDSGLDEDEFRDAYFHRARAYDLQSDLGDEARSKAILYYDSFLKQFPTGKWSDEAAIRSYRLRAGEYPPAGVRESASEFLRLHPDSPEADGVLADRAVAELALHTPSAAVQSWKELIERHPSSHLISRAWLSLGQSYALLNLQDSALICWKNVLSLPVKTSFTLAALRYLADDSWKRKKYAEAADLLRRISTEYFYTPAYGNAEDRLIDALTASGSYAAAISKLRARIPQIDAPIGIGEKDDLFVRLAAAYERKGEKQEATAFYLKYLRRNPTGELAGTAFLALGGLARSQGKPTIAAAYFQQASALGGTATVSREVADLLFQSEQYADAIRQYTQLAASADSASGRIYFRSRIIIGTLRLGKTTEAQTLIESFRKSFPKLKEEPAEFAYERGLLAYRKQEYESARKIFDSLTDDYSGTRYEPWGYFYLAKIQEVNNKSEDAAKRYESILKKFPRSDVLPRVYLSLGNMHFNVERFEDAIQYYQRIMEHPDLAGEILPFAMNNLIEAYESTKLYDNALQVARDFITRFPADESVLDKKVKIGSLYTKLGYYDQAILHFQSLIDEAGSLMEAELRYSTGEAYYYKGDYQQAILEFLKVPYLVAKQGKVDWTATSLYMAGQSYEKMSRFDEALGMYQQIVDRSGIDATFKGAARKEIERVKQLTKKGSK
jgi:TolA-binding protein